MLQIQPQRLAAASKAPFLHGLGVEEVLGEDGLQPVHALGSMVVASKALN